MLLDTQNIFLRRNARRMLLSSRHHGRQCLQRPGPASLRLQGRSVGVELDSWTVVAGAPVHHLLSQDLPRYTIHLGVPPWLWNMLGDCVVCSTQLRGVVMPHKARASPAVRSAWCVDCLGPWDNHCNVGSWLPVISWLVQIRPSNYSYSRTYKYHKHP